MAHGFTAKIWGFALDGASLPDLMRSFADLTRAGECNWVVIRVHARLATLKVPPGYRMVAHE